MNTRHGWLAESVAALLLLQACGGDSGSPGGTTANGSTAGPFIASLSPASATAAGAAFTLTVNGGNFTATSVVRWNGSTKATTFVSASQLNAAIAASDILGPAIAQISVADGARSSFNSAFPINNAVPDIAGMAPTRAPAGSAPVALTVDGRGFSPTSSVNWNGRRLPTTYLSNARLTAVATIADLANPGTAKVTVSNPAPGGGNSAAADFTIDPAVPNPAPVATSISPATLTAEMTGFGIVVTGSGFTASSVGQWNGSARRTSVRSSTQLVLYPLPQDNATSGDAFISVLNPAPGGGASTPHRVPIIALAADALGVTDRLSVASDAAEADSGSSGRASITSDGRFVAFASDAANLVAGDTNARSDVFVRDTCRGAPPGCTPSIALVSLATDGSPANGASFEPSISADGRFVAFESGASNLVPGDVDTRSDVFVRDTCVGATACTPSTSRVSVAIDGSPPDNQSGSPAISGSGRYVSFESSATNLVSGDTNTTGDIFVRDTCSGVSGCIPSTARVSVTGDGSQSIGGSTVPSISLDGRLIAFQSAAINLVEGDNNRNDDIFVRDTCTGASGCTPATTRVSVGGTGAEGNAESYLPTISKSGRFIAFTSSASNLVAADTNGAHDVFVRDTCFGAGSSCTPSTARASVATDGSQANAPSGGPATMGASLSGDGHFVAFGSRASNLVGGDAGDDFDIFVRDTCLAASGCIPKTTRVSVALDGTAPAGRSDGPVLSQDGRAVVFVTSSSRLLPGDLNGTSDLVLARTGLP